MTKKEIKEFEEKMKNFKPKYLYNRYDGVIRKYEVVDNLLINVKNTNDIIDRERYGILGNISENIIDLIEVGDYLDILADGEPLRFEVDEIDYKHKLKDIADDIKIKSIITKEQMKIIEYIVEE